LQYYVDVAYRYRRSSVVCHSVCHSREPKGICRYGKGGHAPSIWTSSPDCLPGLCPWTTLEDFRPPDLLLSPQPWRQIDAYVWACKNGWTNWDAIWDMDSDGLKEAYSRWHGLANMTAQSMCGGDAALCQLFWPLVYNLLSLLLNYF